MAEAPSDSSSMRSTAAIGMEFRSCELPIIGAVGARRPSIRIRVRLVPRPRRLMPVKPWPELPEVDWKEPKVLNEVLRRKSATEMSPLLSSCSRPMTVTGSAPSISARLMREPVTSMRSRVWLSDCLASCARARPGAATPTASAMTMASRSLWVLKLMTLCLQEG